MVFIYRPEESLHSAIQIPSLSPEGISLFIMVPLHVYDLQKHMNATLQHMHTHNQLAYGNPPVKQRTARIPCLNMLTSCSTVSVQCIENFFFCVC